MMLLKKIIIYSIIFIIIGELMVRFDESFTPMAENRVVKISTDIELTPEFQLLKKDQLDVDENDLRIMVIGDSYIHGGGIEFKDNFSQQLKKLLNSKNNEYKNIWVLDISKSSSNNLDNNKTYFQFVTKFKPHIVILGYNLNDTDGNLDKEKSLINDKESFKKSKTSSNQSISLIKKIYNIIYNSRFIHYSFKNLHRKLNTFGVIIPNSNFDRLIKSYYKNSVNWQKSKVLLNEIITDTKQKGIELMVYYLPETNLLEYPELFLKANRTIEKFFLNKKVIYLDGNDALRGGDSKDFILSKYDGHPNEKAHKKMAEHVFDSIKNFKYTRAALKK